jgi:PAS domain S-box-containing protein
LWYNNGGFFWAVVIKNAARKPMSKPKPRFRQNMGKQQPVEEELRKLSQAVEQSASTIMITDLSGTIEFVNPAFTRITGYTPEEAIGHNANLLKSGQVSPESYRQLWATISQGQVWEGELLNRKKGGELYWEWATISPVKDDAGQITHFVAVKEDITRRKQAEAMAQESRQKLEIANERLAIIQEISRVITAQLDVSTVLTILAESTAKLLGADASAILLLDETTQTLTIHGAYGLSEHVIKYTRDPLGTSIAGRVAHQGKAIVINDIPDNPMFDNPAAKNEGLLACASVPLIVGDRVIGTLDVHSKTRGYTFDEEQIYFLHLLAGQAAIAIENARLFEAEREAKETTEKANTALTTLNAIAFAVNNSLDVQADLENALNIILQETKLNQGWLFVPEDNGRLLRLVTCVGLPDEFRRQETLTPADHCACGAALRDGERRHHFGDNGCQRLRPYQKQHPHLSVDHISLPVRAKQEVVGLLNLGGANISSLTPDNYEWLEAVAQQIGNAIENSRLYQSILSKAERLTVLNRISSVVSTSWELDEVLPPLLREMARILETSLGVLVLRAEETRERYKVRAQFGYWRSKINLDSVAWHTLPFLKIIEQTHAPVMIPKAATDQRLTPLANLIAQEDMGTVLVLPLVVQNQVTGFIQLATVGNERIFESTEVELARTLTNQAAVAIEKARLYEATVARYEQELEIARQIQQNLLPHLVPDVLGLRIAGLCRPAYATGGDFYDYILLPHGRLGIVVSDVTGKSLPAAMVMAMARNTIRSELLKTPWPAEAMTAANKWLYQDTQRDTFVATVQALIDPDKRTMWLVNAGQTATLLLRSGQTTYLMPEEAMGLPLGIDQHITYGQAQIPLQTGDTLLFYTDGIVEAQNDSGEMFSFDRLEATLQHIRKGLTPQQIIDLLLAQIQTFVGDAEQHDDITLVVVQVD